MEKDSNNKTVAGYFDPDKNKIVIAGSEEDDG